MQFDGDNPAALNGQPHYLCQLGALARVETDWGTQLGRPTYGINYFNRIARSTVTHPLDDLQAAIRESFLTIDTCELTRLVIQEPVAGRYNITVVLIDDTGGTL